MPLHNSAEGFYDTSRRARSFMAAAASFAAYYSSTCSTKRLPRRYVLHGDETADKGGWILTRGIFGRSREGDDTSRGSHYRHRRIHGDFYLSVVMPSFQKVENVQAYNTSRDLSGSI